MATIRDYNVTVSNATASVRVNDKSKTSYAALPTIDEIRSVTGGTVSKIELTSCFSGCEALTTAPAIPSGVTSMWACFNGCTSLTTAPTIPRGVTRVGYCFAGCTSLTTAPTIPSSVTDMQSCFAGCTALTTARTIPNGVTDMNSCFTGCTSLTTAPTIPSSVTDLSSCFASCTSLTTAPTIPSSVTDMSYCFAYCISLTTAPTIPSSVTDMQSCFGNCTSLTTAPAIPSGVTNISYCFDGCTSLTTAPTIPSSVTDMQSCFGNCTSLTTAPAIPNSVTNIAGCFEDCTSLTTAPTIPSSVANIASCFNGCTSLTTAPTIPSSVTNMGSCFAYCTALTGKIVINANPSIYTKCMKDTQQDIVLTGSSAQLQNIANTATNNNVYVWSLSINVSAERQEDDFSKANVSVIINRFRNNNESVSLTFTINSVESAPVQVTMDTVTKTYTGVLSITPFSTVELSVIAEDSYGKSAPKSITMPIPFYTIDFQAGGKEIAVGAPANDDTSNHPNGLFKCVMDAQFGRNAEFYGNLVLGTALSIANGGTGATTAGAARTNLNVPSIDKIKAMLFTSYTETLTVTADTFTNNGCDAILVGNNLYLYFNAKAKAAISAGNISNKTMLTITFTDDRIAILYSATGSGGSYGPNSQMQFSSTSSGGQHTIIVTLAAIAQNIAKDGIINAHVSMPCVLNWDAY